MKHWPGVEGAWRLEDQGSMSCPTSIAHPRNQGLGHCCCFIFFAFELENHTSCAIVPPSTPAQAGSSSALRPAESSHLGLEWAELSGALDVKWRNQGLVRSEAPAVPSACALCDDKSVSRGYYPNSGPGAVPEVRSASC